MGNVSTNLCDMRLDAFLVYLKQSEPVYIVTFIIFIIRIGLVFQQHSCQIIKQLNIGSYKKYKISCQKCLGALDTWTDI